MVSVIQSGRASLRTSLTSVLLPKRPNANSECDRGKPHDADSFRTCRPDPPPRDGPTPPRGLSRCLRRQPARSDQLSDTGQSTPLAGDNPHFSPVGLRVRCWPRPIRTPFFIHEQRILLLLAE